MALSWKKKLKEGQRFGPEEDIMSQYATFKRGSYFDVQKAPYAAKRKIDDYTYRNMSDAEKEAVVKKEFQHTTGEDLGMTPDELDALWNATGQQSKRDLAKKTTEWGAESLTKDDFIDPSTGEPIPLNEVASNLKAKLGTSTTKTEEEILKLVRDMAPKFEGVTQRAKDKAAMGFKEDVYGLQGEAQKAGQQMQQAYGGMGASMRGAVGTQKGLAAGLEQKEERYKTAQEDLQEEAEKGYETDIAGFLKASLLKKGGYIFKTKAGNRNRSKKTFLDILSEIPDGKGI